MLHSTRFLNKLNKSIHMYLIPTPNYEQILGLFRIRKCYLPFVADSNMIDPLAYK